MPNSPRGKPSISTATHQDKHLATSTSEYLVGDKCTTADVAHWGWVTAAGWAGVVIEDFSHLKAWEERMLERLGVERGWHVLSLHRMKEMLRDKEARQAAESAKWIQREQRKDAERG